MMLWHPKVPSTPSRINLAPPDVGCRVECNAGLILSTKAATPRVLDCSLTCLTREAGGLEAWRLATRQQLMSVPMSSRSRQAAPGLAVSARQTGVSRPRGPFPDTHYAGSRMNSSENQGPPHRNSASTLSKSVSSKVSQSHTCPASSSRRTGPRRDTPASPVGFECAT